LPQRGALETLGTTPVQLATTFGLEQRRATQQRLNAARESVYGTEHTRLLIHEVLRPQMALFVRGVRPRVPDLFDTGEEQLAPTAIAGRLEEKQRRQRRPGR